MTSSHQLSASMFTGSIVALVTPFTEGGEPDLAALDRLVDFHLANATDGIVVAGTTGESASLAVDEFTTVLTRVVERVRGRLAVLAGTGSPSTRVAAERTRMARECGADAALVVTPYYVKPPQAGLEAHFAAVADAAGLPVVLYNVPSRTAVDMLPETVERLSSRHGIVGIKEAVPDPDRIAELVARCGPGFAVLSGDDNTFYRAMRQGARGVVSVAANVAPALIHELCDRAAAEDWAAGDAIDGRLRPLLDALMFETNPIPVKWALFEMGMVGPAIRLPLTALDGAFRERLRATLAELDLLPA
jgi:4-hydroxy-tetrahydrodipicolinate synthase